MKQMMTWTAIAGLVLALAPGATEAQTVDNVINDAVGFWSFGEGSGTTAGDSSGTEPSIPLSFGGSPSPSWQTSGGPASGIFGNYLQFDGGNYLTTGGDEDALDFVATNQLSVAGWVNMDANSGIRWMVSKMESSGDYRGWMVLVRGSASSSRKNCVELFLRESNAANTLMIVHSDIGSLPEQEWKHVAVTYDGSPGTSGVTIYIDGVSQNVSSGTQWSLPVAATMENSIPFNIGGRNNVGSVTGGLDEIGVWRRVLTSGEVLALMTNAKPTPAGTVFIFK